MQSLSSFIQESLNEAKVQKECLANSEDAKKEIEKVKDFGIFVASNKSEKAKVILGLTEGSDEMHFMIKPQSAGIFYKMTPYSLVSHFDIEKAFANSKINECWIIYKIWERKNSGSRINGVHKSILTFYAGEYGELWNTDKEARAAIKKAKSEYKLVPGSYKVCQIKDMEQLSKDQEKNYSWDVQGLKFIVKD